MISEVIVTEKELPEDVITAIRQGHKIEAIKLLREATGLGLANAKVLVDKAARIHAPAKSIPSFEDQSTSWGGLVKLLSLLAVAIGAWYYFKT